MIFFARQLFHTCFAAICEVGLQGAEFDRLPK